MNKRTIVSMIISLTLLASCSSAENKTVQSTTSEPSKDTGSASVTAATEIVGSDNETEEISDTETEEQQQERVVYHFNEIDHNAVESHQRPVERVENEVDQEILQTANQRREAIKSSSSDLEISGTAYYVSEDGSDSNSGLSPEDAWQTISKVNASSLNPGDAVLFKRGETWRGECLRLIPGVTYSAFGEGVKPAIYGSPENGTGAEKWTLMEGTENIWVYCKDLLECGTIVLNDETGAFKINAFVRDGQFLMPDGSGREFDVKEALDRDLSFWSEDTYFLTHGNAWEDERVPIKLYLRCDEGNPGEIYSSIEFCTWTVTDGGKGLLYTVDESRDVIIVDDLTLKYTGGYGIYLTGASAVVQNCEIGWIGGCTTNTGEELFIRSGNCVGNFGAVENYQVRNCYLYQAFDSGISSEGAEWNQKDIIFTGNLIENCLFGIEMLSGDDAGVDMVLEDAEMSDNIITYSGYGFGSVRQQKYWNIHDVAIMFHPYYDALTNVRIENNVLYKSRTYLILCGTKEKPMLTGNTYIQNNMGGLCLWGNNGGLDEYLYDIYAAETVREILRDESAVVAELSY